MAVNQHVLMSTGAPKQHDKPFDTYQTSYEMGHGHTGFTPRSPPKQRTTGYSGNFRAGVYYRPEIDRIDNPNLGAIIEESFNRSQTKRHYEPLSVGDSGRGMLPANAEQEGGRYESGFAKQGAPPTLPLDSEARYYHAQEREQSSVTLRPRTGDYLKTLSTRRDPVQSENQNHGPALMSTEMHSRYRGEPTGRVGVHQKSVGKLNKSGWTHAQNDEPITHRAHDPFSTTTEKTQYRARPVGSSIQQVDFLSPPQHTGRESLPPMHLAGNTQHDTGFTRDSDSRAPIQHRRSISAYEPLETLPALVSSRIEKSDPARYMNAAFPDNHSSVTTNCFEDIPQLASSAPPTSVKPTILDKETTGGTRNNDQYLRPGHEHPSFYNSHYSLRFNDKAPQGIDRQGYFGKANTAMLDGFSKSTRFHGDVLGTNPDPMTHLSGLHPYVARSIIRRDPCFIDNPHAHKIRT